MMDEMDYTQPAESFLRSIDVHELLPQQEPFVMISRLTHFDKLRTVTETIISEDNIFVENGCFTASGLMENIAQTCAARITTTVDVMEEIFGMTLANSTVQLGKNILVTAEMKIALKNDGTESK